MKQVETIDVAIVGAGPTGLMAAELAAKAGRKVVVFDRMRQPGRKFLLAGSDGLNLTFDEPLEHFANRYDFPDKILPLLTAFTPIDVRSWADGLGADTFVGSSKRVFPRAMKASPLLRAWLRRLDSLGVEFRGSHQLTGWTKDTLEFDQGTVQASDVVLAMGGASWPRMGTDGGWQSLFPDDAITAIQPSNCAFPVQWSDKIWPSQDGASIKNIAVKTLDGWKPGDIRLVKGGLEGTPIYAAVRQWQQRGVLHLDLLPHRDEAWLEARWAKMPPKASTSAKLKRLNLKPAALALINEVRAAVSPKWPKALKALPLKPTGPTSMDRAISTSGGVNSDHLTQNLAYQHRPNTYIGGEMLDWDAPTGGYLLQACFSMGYVIGTELAKNAN